MEVENVAENKTNISIAEDTKDEGNSEVVEEDIKDDSNSDQVAEDKPLTFRNCEITQDCEYGWDLNGVECFIKGWSSIKNFAYILHDKDYKEGTDELRKPHIHLMLRFNYPTPITAIVNRAINCGLPKNCITNNRIERMRNWSFALNYLTHRDEHKPWKHIYNDEDVISNFDWKLVAETAHQKKVLNTSVARAKEIVELIDNGTIREYNLHEYLTAWEENQYSNYIAKAFKRVISREKLKGERDMDVVFICGPSGVGKDTFARALCKERNLIYYNTSNNDQYPFDDYKGQPAIIWSDARDNIYKPQQLFSLLDNHWKSAQKARYSDINLDCKLLIITSIKPLYEWYSTAFDDANEDRKQLYRRIETYCAMDYDSVSIFAYDESVNEYSQIVDIPNTYSHREDYLDTAEKRKQFVSKMFGGLVDAANFAKKKVDEIPLEKFEDVKDIDN